MSDRPPTRGTVTAAAIAALLEGAWFFLDGVHRLVTGDYIPVRESLGPWADMVAETGFDPMGLGALFLVLGSGILVGGVGLLGGRRWAWSWAVAAFRHAG